MHALFSNKWTLGTLYLKRTLQVFVLPPRQIPAVVLHNYSQIPAAVSDAFHWTLPDEHERLSPVSPPTCLDAEYCRWGEGVGQFVLRLEALVERMLILDLSIIRDNEKYLCNLWTLPRCKQRWLYIIVMKITSPRPRPHLPVGPYFRHSQNPYTSPRFYSLGGA